MDIWEKIKSEFHKGDSAVKQIIIVNLAVFIFTILVGVVATVSGFHSSDLLKVFCCSQRHRHSTNEALEFGYQYFLS